MFLLNKVTAAKLSSREHTQDDRAEFQQDMSGMDYMYVGASEFRPKSSRSKNSKPRTSFFGSKRRSGVEDDASSKESLPLPPTSPRRTLNEKPSMGSLSSGSRRRLRKASSKTSLAASFLSQGSDEGRPVSRVDQLLGRGLHVGGGQGTIASSRSRGASISQPFNFTHLSHADQRDANAIPAGANEVGKEWNRALVRESHMRPLTAKASMSSLHSRDNSMARERANSTLSISVSPRTRANSTMSISPAESFLDLAAAIPPLPVPALQEPVRNACPITPPLRASSRHCLRILEHPEEEHMRRDNDIPEVSLTEYEEGEVGAAVTTPGDSSFGSKSVGVQPRTSRDGADLCPASPPVDASFEPLFDESRFPTDISNMPYVERYNPERFTPPAINLMPPFDPTSRLLPPRSRPLSQMSAVSDTLNGHFAIPPGPMKNRRLSRRISTLRRSIGPPNADGSYPAGDPMSDDWEQDIDWCYEHEADADCDFNWDKGSAYSASVYSPIEEEEDAPKTIPVPVLPERTVSAPPRKTFNKTIEVPELRQQSLIIEKRITGLFEDKLLLPPSPGYPPTPRSPPQHYKSARDRERDSGFASVRSVASTEEPVPLIRAMRHRSISSSPSMPDLGLLGRSGSYREELCRVAKQLDDHIAALNKDMYQPTSAAAEAPRNSATADGPIPTLTISNRARANSEATCVTLCSDTDTVTPTEANEIITPSSSAHNSYNFMKPRSSSVVGGGLAVESRAEKSMSFPSAAIPGVIEVGPDSLYHPEETEFVHFF